MNDRRLTDSATLYRSTPSKSTSGVVTTGYDSGTATDCLFFPEGGRSRPDQAGNVVEYDAVMIVSASADVRPNVPGQTPDKIGYDSRYYVVERVHNAAGRCRYKEIMLVGVASV